MTDHYGKDVDPRVTSPKPEFAEIETTAEYLNPDRKRGIFTRNDRQYIMEKELTGQKERDARYRIRQRLRNGLLDMGLVAGLHPDDRLRVYESFESEVTLEEVQEEEEYSVDERRYIAYALMDTAMELIRVWGQSRDEDLESLIEELTRYSIMNAFKFKELDVSIDAEYFEINEDPLELLNRIINEGGGDYEELVYISNLVDVSTIKDSLPADQEKLTVHNHPMGDEYPDPYDVPIEIFEEAQEETGIEFSPEMIKQSRYRKDK